MKVSSKILQKSGSINCGGKLLDLSKPKIMAILNITPDSFFRPSGRDFSQSKYNEEIQVLKQAENFLNEGAHILDIGGMSTRPGSVEISTDEELKRVIPEVEALHKNFPETILSVDTVKSRVAEESVNAGAHIINDISAGSMDKELLTTVARLKVPYTLMHMQGRPSTMQKDPRYTNVSLDVLDFFIEKTALLRSMGIRDIILDPGFGFGKTLEHNYTLLKHLNVFEVLELPVLAGISRKSMICKLLGQPPEDALNGTTAVHMLALQNGANILRVHDVKEAREVINIRNFYETL